MNVALNGSATTHTFAYDYRSRRYYRETPKVGGGTEHMYSVFDGGLSVQEYTVPQASSLPTSATLTTEFIRGEGMGGGVGGMVYSIKDDGNGNDKIICSHANHRGDVIARSNASGSLTSFALYEAYGTRPYEWGDDPDRQKANTKEEESDLNLLNEGMRFRDLETGVFLTRDPIGYGDGPNVYCYVKCNPIVRFDPLGLIINWDKATNEGADFLYEKAANDPVFAEQMMNWAMSDNVVTIDNTEKGTHFLWYEKDGTEHSEYKPKTHVDDPKGAKTPGVGSDATLAFSATENFKVDGKEKNPSQVVDHEGQHVTDAVNGQRDTTPNEDGLPKNEERATRRENENAPDGDKREKYNGLDVKDFDVPLEDPVPETDQQDYYDGSSGSGDSVA